MTPIARTPLPTRIRRTAASRIVGVGAAIALAAGLASCAAGPSLYDRGGFAAAGDSWDGASSPQPVRTPSTVAHNGSMPLLPPVPPREDGLAPIKVTAYAD